MRRTQSVPYPDLAHAEQTATAMFPAARINALWTPNGERADVCVEITEQGCGHTKVVPWANGRPAC